MELSIHQLLRNLEIYSEKKAELKIELQRVQDKIVEIHNQILHLQSLTDVENPNDNSTSYRKNNGGVIDKTLYSIEKSKRCLSVREIVDLIKAYENKDDDKVFDRKMIGQVNFSLKYYISKNKLVKRFKPSNSKEWVYGIKEWFDPEGFLKEEYKSSEHYN